MSFNAAIRAEGLGKLYRLGTRLEPRLTLREQINRLALSPYYRLQSVLRGDSARLTGDDFWALKDFSIDVSYGEVVGVIGRNGAGKSTLLKILSRITEPTHGRAEIRGRVGSLLEVGTGFHSELTGRENIFLSGVILGMTRAEIATKLDQIVAFAEVERFVDTQVKHYSSGMSLRLAFAVAAHLQPEILLVDEVLAVGDAAFQRKCLGKMSDVAQQGRAIIFVSHDLEAVQRLCDRCIWLDGGRLRQEGDPATVVRDYLAHGENLDTSYHGERRPGPDEPIVLRTATILDTSDQQTDSVCFGEPFAFQLDWDVARPMLGLSFDVHVHDANERLIFSATTADPDVRAGQMRMICRVRDNVLRPGDYGVTISCTRPPRSVLHRVERCLRLRVLNVPAPGKRVPILNRYALVAPEIRWEPDESDVTRPCDIDAEDTNTPIEHVHSKAGKQVVSIVIPTHNRCRLLARTLQSLSQTIVPPETSVDLVIVASACTDDTSKVISNARFGSAWDVRTIDEPLAGVSAARNSGLKAARADLIAFLDDDVWVEPDWLAALVHAADHLPAQVFAGRVTLEWDDRPSWTSPAVENLLAVNDHGLQVRELSGPRRLVGVNFAVRRSVIESVGAFSPALGRRGTDLLSGAEAELAWRALANGHRVFYVPRMSVRHWISSERASIAHLKRLAVGRGRTRVALRRACRQPNALACARTSVRQAIQGIVREIDGWVHRDQAKRVAGSLLFQRGVATLSALWTQVFSSHV